MKTLYKRVTVDQCVSPSPVWVYALVITSDGGGEADAVVYNGESTSGETVINLYTVDEAMAQLVFPTPLYLDKGLYIDIGTNVKEVLVQYTSEAE